MNPSTILMVFALCWMMAGTVHGYSDEDQRFIIDRDVAFLPQHRPEKLDLYIPPDPKPGTTRPGIVLIHGGGWTVGDKSDPRERQIASVLANAGFVVASINYQLATRDKPAWPTCLDDCRSAVDYLRQRAADLAIDPDRIGAVGASAGGTMALLLGVDYPDTGFKKVQAIVALYAPSDLTQKPFESPLIFGVARDQRPDLLRSASPLFKVHHGFPPTLLIHGTADNVVSSEQSQGLADRLKEMNVVHELILLKDGPHSFPIFNESHDLRDKIIRFFRQYLQPDIGPQR